jgi:hypothetical protein
MRIGLAPEWDKDAMLKIWQDDDMLLEYEMNKAKTHTSFQGYLVWTISAGYPKGWSFGADAPMEDLMDFISFLNDQNLYQWVIGNYEEATSDVIESDIKVKLLDVLQADWILRAFTCMRLVCFGNIVVRNHDRSTLCIPKHNMMQYAPYDCLL